MRNLIISILMWLSFIGCSDKDGLLSPAEMKEDIRFYFHMIRDIHPDPYQRYDSLTFVRLEAEMIESCSEPMAREDSWMGMSGFSISFLLRGAIIFRL